MKRIVKVIILIVVFTAILHGISRINFQINPAACDMCGRCMNSCPTGAIQPDVELMCLRIDQNLCDGCGDCLHNCPRSAIYEADGRSYIFGRVCNSETNFAINGVTVSNGIDSATTDFYGDYSLEVTQGSYSITTTHPDFNSYTIENITIGSNDAERVNIVMNPLTSNSGNVSELTSLLECYPNPFSNNEPLNISIKNDNKNALLTVTNVKGQLLYKRKIIDSDKLVWNGVDSKGHKLPSGIYLLNLKSGNETISKRITLR